MMSPIPLSGGVPSTDGGVVIMPTFAIACSLRVKRLKWKWPHDKMVFIEEEQIMSSGSKQGDEFAALLYTILVDLTEV